MNWLKPPIKIKFKRLDVGQDFTNVCQSEYEGFFYNILLHTSYFNDFKLTFEVQNHILSSGICEILLHIFWACDLYDNPAMT